MTGGKMFWPFNRRTSAAPPPERKAAAAFIPSTGPMWAPPKSREYITDGYQRSPVIYRAVHDIASAIANLPVEAAENGEYAPGHPALALLARPNPRHRQEAFLAALATDMLCLGECAVLASSEPTDGSPPVELWPVSPLNVTVEPGRQGLPAAYRLAHGDGATPRRYPVDQITGRSQLLFSILHNPIDPWRGQSPLQAVALAADTHTAGQRWNFNLLRNSGRPSGIIRSDQPIGQEAQARLREMFLRSYQGTDNAGAVPVLEGGLEWQAIDTTPRDMDFQATQTEAARLISAALGVPAPMTDPATMTYANYSTAREMFHTETVLPLAARLLADLSAWLAPAWGGNVALRVDMDGVHALDPQRERLYTRMLAARTAGVLTVNEVRAAMGYDAIPGGDELAAPLPPIEAAADHGTLAALAWGAHDAPT